MNKSLLCPYCFEYFRLDAIHWRCVNTTCRNPARKTEPPGEIDTVYTKYLDEFGVGAGGQRRLLRAFSAPQATSGFRRLLDKYKPPRMANCDWCSRPTPRRLCPNCHSDLPYTVDTVDNHIIAIIGPQAVGKSHYITVLIEQFRQQVGADFGMSLLALNDSTTERYKNEFYNKLYRDKQQLLKTQQQNTASLMYRLSFASDDNPLHRSRSLTLVFFDTAGENLDAEETMTARTRYLTHASAIILLVDPLQIENLRQDLGSRNCSLPASHTEPVEIVDRVIRMFHTFGNINSNAKIPVPLAVAFTKSDVLRDYDVLRQDSAVYSQPRHKSAFQNSVFHQIHDEVQATMTTWCGPELESKLSQFFKTYAYFCLSSLGEAPEPDGSLATISPFRVEDPFLWCLFRLGYMKMK